MTIAIILGFIIFVILAAKKQKHDEALKQATGRMFQMLESFTIIDSTIKLEIFTQRLNFMRDLAKGIPQNVNLDQLADVTLKNYARKYPKVYITPTYRQILRQPQIVQTDKFRDEAATAFYMRTCENLKEQIITLKTPSAKHRRIEQAEEWSKIIIAMLESSDKQRYITAILETCAGVASLTPNTAVKS